MTSSVKFIADEPSAWNSSSDSKWNDKNTRICDGIAVKFFIVQV
jgi:hypothetical protein